MGPKTPKYMIMELFLLVILLIQLSLNAFRFSKCESSFRFFNNRFHVVNNFEHTNRKISCDVLKLKDKLIEDNERVVKSDKSTTRSQSAISRLLENAQKLRSEVEMIESSNFTEPKIPYGFSDFVTTKITDMAAVQTGLKHDI